MHRLTSSAGEPPVILAAEHSGGAAAPLEAIPKQPVLSVATLRSPWRAGGVCASVLDAERLYFVRLGRTALEAICRSLALQPGDGVLLPAYHCVSMVEPVLRAHADPIFYRVRSDATVDLDDFRRVAVRGVRAAVVPHYFGFHQRMAEVRGICDERGITLVEDCAHCLYGEIDGRPVGSFGDYAIASPWKFLPVIEGGCLVVNTEGPLAVQLRAQNVRAELKSLLNMLEASDRYGRMRAANVFFRPIVRLANSKNERRRRARARAPDAAREDNPSRADLRPVPAIDAMTRVFRSIVRRTDHARVVSLRRRHYRFLLEQWRELRGARPLHGDLPEGVVPQVFPLVVDAPETASARLKRAGVPVIRFGEYLWEGMSPATCPATLELSRTVFQLPCHQELTTEEVQWLAATVCDVFGRVDR